MSVHKYLDWKGYFKGLYLSWIKTFTTSALTLLGTNAVEQMGVKDIGIDWRQAVSMFLVITVVEVLRYVQAKPLPETVIEETNTEFITKPKP